MSSHSRPSSAVGLGDKELERGRSQMKMSTSNGGTSCFDSRVSSCRLDTRDVRGTGSLPFLYIIYCIFVILHTAWMWFWVQFFLILHCFNHRPYTAADSWWTRAWSTLSPFTLSASLLLSLKANVKIWATAGVAAPYVGLYIYIYTYTYTGCSCSGLLWLKISCCLRKAGQLSTLSALRPAKLSIRAPWPSSEGKCSQEQDHESFLVMALKTFTWNGT